MEARPSKRPRLSDVASSEQADDFGGNADFLSFEPESRLLPKDSRSSAHTARSFKRDATNNGSTKRVAIDIDLEEGDVRQGAQPWAHYVSWEAYQDATSQINAELGAFLDYMTPTAAEHQLRAELIADIARAIRTRYRDADVQPFGSFATQSYLPFGDIDLVVMSNAIASKAPKKVLFELAALLKSRSLAKDVIVIHKARVPIVKFVSVRGNIRMDISLNQAGGLKAVPVVNSLLAQNGDRAARALVFFVKAYLRSRDLNEVFSGGISSFSIICMVVSFLQMHPRVRSGEIDPLNNMGVLLVEFFELYGKHFNYEIIGISVVRGGTYYGKDARGWQQNNRSGLYLSIEDPGDPENDIASGAYNTYAIRQAFAAAYDALITALHSRNYALYRAASESTGPFFGTDPSLLGAIYAMSVEEIAKRKQNARDAATVARKTTRHLPPLQMKDLGDKSPNARPPPVLAPPPSSNGTSSAPKRKGNPDHLTQLTPTPHHDRSDDVKGAVPQHAMFDSTSGGNATEEAVGLHGSISTDPLVEDEYALTSDDEDSSRYTLHVSQNSTERPRLSQRQQTRTSAKAIGLMTHVDIVSSESDEFAEIEGGKFNHAATEGGKSEHTDALRREDANDLLSNGQNVPGHQEKAPNLVLDSAREQADRMRSFWRAKGPRVQQDCIELSD